MAIDKADLIYAMRYPFSKRAKKTISGQTVDIDFDVMERSKWRVKTGIENEEIPVIETSDEKLLMRELLSYPVSRMIVSSLEHIHRTRYVNSEIRRALRYLRDNEKDMFELAKEFEINHDGFLVAVNSYLRYMPKSRECKLLTQKIIDGKVSLDGKKFLAMIGEAIRQNVSAGLPMDQDTIPGELKKDLEEAVKEVSGEIKDLRFSGGERIMPTATGVVAPCMKAIMDKARAGENIPHFARVAIATYMLKRGHTVDDVVELISHTPNFNDKVTRYQVEFIKKKGYNVTSCSNMESYGLRLPECGCLGRTRIKNPMSYGYKGKSGNDGWKGRNVRKK